MTTKDVLVFCSRTIAVVLTTILLTACNKVHRYEPTPTSGSFPADAPMSLRATFERAPPPFSTNATKLAIADERKPDSTLAYTHELQVEVGHDYLQAQLDAVRNECTSDKTSECTILSIESSLNSSVPSGSISMRLSPNRIEHMISVAGEHGKITSRSTSAEDLAPELNDSAQKLATLNVYRERLNGFMAKKDMAPDQLIAVAKELSTTQTQIEELGSTRAVLKRRIDTDLLNMAFRVPTEEYSQQQTPIKDSLKSFGQHFRDAVAGVVNFIAYVLPWIPVIFLLFIGLRKVWVLLRKKPSNAAAT